MKDFVKVKRKMYHLYSVNLQNCNNRKRSKMKSGKLQQQFLLPRWNSSPLALIIVLSSTLLSSVMVKASDSDVRYYAVPKTCDIYNNGYSATFGDGARVIRNCIDSDKINELTEKGETENYKVCKADVHGEGWWGECDPGCDGDRKCGPPRTTDSEPGTPKPEDCRPDKPLCNHEVRPCVFPFKHGRFVYDTCTTAGDSGSETNRTFSWCATKTSSDGRWILRAECKAVTFPLNAKAEAKNVENDVWMRVTLSQDTESGTTTYGGDFAGLDPSKTYGLTVVQATEINANCSRPRTAKDPPRGVGMALNPNEEAEYPDRLGDLVPERSGELVVNKTDRTGHVKMRVINKILKQEATLYGPGADMGKSLLGRVLVLHEKCDRDPNDGDPNEEWAKCQEQQRFKACARFELVPQESGDEWIALILIIVFCVLIIIIILAVIIYCCIKNKCCGKYTTVPVDCPGPTPDKGSSPDPELPTKPVSPSPLDGDDIPFADRPDLFTQTSDIGSIFLKEKYGDGAYKSRESLSRNGQDERPISPYRIREETGFVHKNSAVPTWR